MFLSVIIPLHNGEKTIKRTIESILNQKFDDMELIISNDASTDSSLDIINEMAQHDYRFDRFELGSGFGFPVKIINTNTDVHCPGNTRQAGLEIAQGDWVTFIDQDDEFKPQAFQTMYEMITKERDLDMHPEYAIFNYICCGLMEQKNDMSGVIYTMDKTAIKDPNENEDDKEEGEDPDVWLHGKFFNRKNLIEKHNISFTKDLVHYEDLAFMLKVKLALIKTGMMETLYLPFYNKTVLYTWHYSGKSTSTSVDEKGGRFDEYGFSKEYPRLVFGFIEDVTDIMRSYARFMTYQQYKEFFAHLLEMNVKSLALLFKVKNKMIEDHGEDFFLAKEIDESIDEARCGIIFSHGATLYGEDFMKELFMDGLSIVQPSNFEPSRFYVDSNEWFNTRKLNFNTAREKNNA